MLIFYTPSQQQLAQQPFIPAAAPPQAASTPMPSLTDGRVLDDSGRAEFIQRNLATLRDLARDAGIGMPAIERCQVVQASLTVAGTGPQPASIEELSGIAGSWATMPLASSSPQASAMEAEVIHMLGGLQLGNAPALIDLQGDPSASGDSTAPGSDARRSRFSVGRMLEWARSFGRQDPAAVEAGRTSSALQLASAPHRPPVGTVAGNGRLDAAAMARNRAALQPLVRDAIDLARGCDAGGVDAQARQRRLDLLVQGLEQSIEPGYFQTAQGRYALLHVVSLLNMTEHDRSRRVSPSEVELQRPLADVRTAAGYTVAEWGRAIGVNSWFVPKHVRAAEGKIGPFPEKLAAVLAPFPDFGSVDPAQTAQLSGADIDLLRNHLQDLASGNAEFHAGLYRIFDLLSAVDTHRGTDYAFEQVPALMRRCGSGPEASRGDTPFGLSQALRLAVDSAQRSGRGENLQLLLALLPELEAGSSTTDLSYSQELLAQLLETVAGLPPDSRPTAGQMANLHTLYRNQLLGEVTADETLLKQGMGFHNAGKVNETVAKFMDWAVRLEIHDPHIPGLRDLIDLSADREFFNWLPIDNLGQRAGVRFVGALEAFTRR